MIDGTMIELKLKTGPRLPQPRVYEIAGRWLSSELRLPELEAFHTGGAGRREPKAIGKDPISSPPQSVFRGPAELGLRKFFLDCSIDGDGLKLSVANQGLITIDRTGERIHCDLTSGKDKSNAATDLVVGPALTLALALQSVWCLHASAVDLEGQLFAFLGVSGIGKSTLAHALPRVSDGQCHCAADDVLPVTMTTTEVEALPRFPQLKYPPDQQPGADRAEALPFAGIYLLDTGSSNTEVSVERVSGHAAVLALVRHTHCTRLFPPELLQRHIDFCVQLASRIPVWRLAYPKRPAILPRVAEMLWLEHGSKTARVGALGGVRAAGSGGRLGRSYRHQSSLTADQPQAL